MKVIQIKAGVYILAYTYISTVFLGIKYGMRLPKIAHSNNSGAQPEKRTEHERFIMYIVCSSAICFTITMLLLSHDKRKHHDTTEPD